MKREMIFTLALFVITIVMANPIDDTSKALNYKYENELFSVQIPLSWGYDDSGWEGLDSANNVVDFKDLSGRTPTMIRIVKTLMPYKHKNIDDATNIARAARMMSKDNVSIYAEDSTVLDGRTTHILVYAIFNDNDTIVQQQYVTYLEESHITMYLNVFCPFSKDINEKMNYADKIIGTIKIKNVNNPLDDEQKLQKVLESVVAKKNINKDKK